jgi:hypothetical protein
MDVVLDIVSPSVRRYGGLYSTTQPVSRKRPLKPVEFTGGFVEDPAP